MGLIYIPLGVFYFSMLYNMIKRHNWIWLIVTITVSVASYAVGQLYWGDGIFVALIYYFVNLRRLLKKKEEEKTEHIKK